MKPDDGSDDRRRIEDILKKMQRLLEEGRLLKQKHDQLAKEYLKLEREFEECMARIRTGRERAERTRSSLRPH